MDHSVSLSCRKISLRRCQPAFFCFSFVSATVLRPHWSTYTTVQTKFLSILWHGNSRLHQPQVAFSSSSSSSSCCSVVSVSDEGESDRFLHLCSSGRFHGPYSTVLQVRFQPCQAKYTHFYSRFWPVWLPVPEPVCLLSSLCELSCYCARCLPQQACSGEV